MKNKFSAALTSLPSTSSSSSSSCHLCLGVGLNHHVHRVFAVGASVVAPGHALLDGALASNHDLGPGLFLHRFLSGAARTNHLVVKIRRKEKKEGGREENEVDERDCELYRRRRKIKEGYENRTQRREESTRRGKTKERKGREGMTIL